MAPTAFCSSWADALHMIHGRPPLAATSFVERLEGEDDVAGCMSELRIAADGLDRQGSIMGRPAVGELDHHQQPSLSRATGHTAGSSIGIGYSTSSHFFVTIWTTMKPQCVVIRPKNQPLTSHHFLKRGGILDLPTASCGSVGSGHARRAKLPCVRPRGSTFGS